MNRFHSSAVRQDIFCLAGICIIFLILVANASASPSIAGCPVFPSNNIWNSPIDSLPVDPNSQDYITTIGSGMGLHADFGSGDWDGGPIGIPFTVVTGSQARVRVVFESADESDPGPYPIPADALVEGGQLSTGDRHVLIVDSDNCILYELYAAYPQADGSWSAGSGAIFNLLSHALRPSNWTSADAAGLPLLPGLVRYDEVASGEMQHAVRFTAPQTRNVFIWPARHYASSLTDQQYPPMGQRFRLKATVDISGFSSDTQVILNALKRYGMILADNGSSWFISGEPDPRWNNDDLHELSHISSSDFEAVDESSLTVSPDLGQALPSGDMSPLLRVNGSDTPPPFGGMSPVSLTASVDASGSSGIEADWWIVANTPFGWYYYTYPGAWNTALSFGQVRPAYQGPLLNLDETGIFKGSGLPAGSYTVFFGIDTAMNGLMDFDQMISDSIHVTITQ